MKAKTRWPLGLEALEDRWVPATIRYDGSNLFVSNPNIAAGASKITVVEAAASNAFTVTDGAASNGTYTVTGNINILGNNAKDTIGVTVSATGLAGNLSIQVGNGNSTVTVDGGAKAAFIAGNTSIVLGSGVDTVNVANTTGMVERGNLTVSARGTGANTAVIGNGTSSVLGRLSVSDVPVLTLGKAGGGDTFAGGIFVQNIANPSASTVTLGGSDLGGFQLSSGQGATSVALNNNVLGNVSLNLANGANSVSTAGATTAISLGSLNINAGNGANSLTLGNAATAVSALGNVNVNLGNGANAFGTSKNLAVNGNMFVNDGNGGLTVTGATDFRGAVAGNLGVNAGNGPNAFELDVTNGGNVAGTFSYTGGNGGNSVTIDNTTASLTTLNVHFGTSQPVPPAGTGNLLTLNAGAPGTNNLTGFVSWAIPTSFVAGTNGLVDNGYVFSNAITFINIPS